jgi:cell division protein FtsZ
LDHIVRNAIARAHAEVGAKNNSKMIDGETYRKERREVENSNANANIKKRDLPDKKGTHSDEDLISMLETSKAKIIVVGCGGGGSNTIDRVTEIGIEGASTFAVNTDAQDLLSTKADKKMLVGRKLTRGLGAGSDPQVGESAARESAEDITDVLSGYDLVFVTCGLGGGTGTGSAPVVAELAKSVKALTVAVVTLPFTVEGKKRMENAMYGLERLQEHTDTIIVIPNDKILEIAPDLPINAAFKVADEVLTNAVKGITEMVTKPGLINLDFADLRTILSRGGAAMIGLGESNRTESAESRALEAVENALTSPLLDVDISGANRALVNVIGGTDMTLREAELIVETVSTKIHNSSHIIWGAMVDERMPKNHIQAMVVIAGGRFPYLDKDAKQRDDKNIDIGIEFA